MKTGKIIALILLMLVSSGSFAQTFIELDISAFNAKEKDIKKAVIHAFLTRSWKIQKVSDTEVIGDHSGYKVVIEYNHLPKIRISYIDQGEDEYGDVDDSGSTGWLLNLKKDFLVEIVRCSTF